MSKPTHGLRFSIVDGCAIALCVLSTAWLWDFSPLNWIKWIFPKRSWFRHLLLARLRQSAVKDHSRPRRGF